MPLWFSPLGHIPVQAQLGEEKRDALLSREVKRLRPSLSGDSLSWAHIHACMCVSVYIRMLSKGGQWEGAGRTHRVSS